MTSFTWIKFTDREKALLLNALSTAYPEQDSEEILNLSAKLSRQDRKFPIITVGVYGGQVQWAMGNPFPIRVCDYDGNEEDLPRVDERGQRCRIWFELPDPKAD